MKPNLSFFVWWANECYKMYNILTLLKVMTLFYIH